MGPDPFSGTPETVLGGIILGTVGIYTYQLDGVPRIFGVGYHHRGGPCRNHDAGNGPGAAGFEIILHHPHPRFLGIRGIFAPSLSWERCSAAVTGI